MMITYKNTLEGVDWNEIKTKLQEDDFDNGRTPEQLKESFQNSYATCIVYDGKEIIAKARVLSDGICNAYVVDVWTYSPYRHRGIATKILETLFDRCSGQHVYLFTSEETVPFYTQLGMKPWGVGMGKIIGTWLMSESIPNPTF